LIPGLNGNFLFFYIILFVCIEIWGMFVTSFSNWIGLNCCLPVLIIYWNVDGWFNWLCVYCFARIQSNYSKLVVKLVSRDRTLHLLL
jgi:hypothetical protein